MVPIADDIPRRGSLPVMSSFSSSGSSASDLTEDRKLPPLPHVVPLPRGPFNPFTPNGQAPSTPTTESFPVKSTWPSSDSIAAPPSPAYSADSPWQEPFSAQKSPELPGELSQSEVLSLIAPRTINRKPPLQQLCGRKRKGSMTGSEPDDQREKHRIAEGNRRKNLSQLHRELDGRLHDFFLVQAGWNPAKSLPQSKEHIVQAAIYLIDFMHLVIFHLIRQENETPGQLPEKLQPEIRCMRLQQLVSNIQQQNQTTQQQLEAMRQEKQVLEDRNRALEFQLKSYEHIYRSPKSEATTPQSWSSASENKPSEHPLPGLRVLCDGVDAVSPKAARRSSWLPGSSQYLGPMPFNTTTPPLTGPSSPALPPPSFSLPSRRESLIPSP